MNWPLALLYYEKKSRWCGRCVLQETNDATCRWLPRGGNTKKAWFKKKKRWRVDFLKQ
jgi:hypothetical protein